MNTKHTFDRFFNDIAKHAIGFDNMFHGLQNIAGSFDSYPPYNFLQTSDNKYQIEVAVAGFNKSEITIILENDFLIIEGKKTPVEENKNAPIYKYRGIANRSFKRMVQLGPNVTVNSAEITDGILNVDLEYIVPDAQKVKTIKIK